jgi:hypothetical protein
MEYYAKDAAHMYSEISSEPALRVNALEILLI